MTYDVTEDDFRFKGLDKQAQSDLAPFLIEKVQDRVDEAGLSNVREVSVTTPEYDNRIENDSELRVTIYANASAAENDFYRASYVSDLLTMPYVGGEDGDKYTHYRLDLKE